VGGREEQSNLGLAVVTVHPAKDVGAFGAMADANSWKA
jgi:hypothetical protein